MGRGNSNLSSVCGPREEAVASKGLAQHEPCPWARSMTFFSSHRQCTAPLEAWIKPIKCTDISDRWTGTNTGRASLYLHSTSVLNSTFFKAFKWFGKTLSTCLKPQSLLNLQPLHVSLLLSSSPCLLWEDDDGQQCHCFSNMESSQLGLQRIWIQHQQRAVGKWLRTSSQEEMPKDLEVGGGEELLLLWRKAVEKEQMEGFRHQWSDTRMKPLERLPSSLLKDHYRP